MAEQLVRHHSHRLQGLTPKSPPTMEGKEGVTMEQLASTNIPTGTALASETREDFTIYTNPLVQLPPAVDVFVHSPMEGHVDGPNEAEYGPDAPFWRTSMGQDIAQFGVIKPSQGNPPLREDKYRIIHASLDQAPNFSERLERIVSPLVPHKEPMSALFPHLSDPWPDGYHSLAKVLGPIEEVPFRGNPGQNSNPTVSYPGPITSPPIPVVVGGEYTTQVM